MSTHRRNAFVIIVMIFGPWAVLAAPPAAPTLSGAEVLAQSRAKYAAMKTYSDTGVITTEFALSRDAAPAVERHSFRTFYSAPRQFLLDFKKDAAAGGERLVIWGDGDNFHTWWSATGVHEVYPHGQGSNAFALSSLPTLGAALAVPPLLFSQAGLHGAMSDFELGRSAGVDKIEGKSFYKLVGAVHLAYGTGTVSAGRATTIWIDTSTLLVGQLFEDTPEGSGADTVDRVTTRFQPQSDAAVDPRVFQFAVPAR